MVAAVSMALTVALAVAAPSQAKTVPHPGKGPSQTLKMPGAGKSRPGPIPWAGLNDPDAARAPGVVVDTMVPDAGSGTPGVRVGDRYFKAPYNATSRSGKPSYEDVSWQVLVLSQRNLIPRWNRTYTNSRQSALVTDLAALKRDPVASTVIMTTHKASGWNGFDPSATSLLKTLNVELSPESIGPAGTWGGFSMVVNINGAQATPIYKWSAVDGGGRMTGMLVYDQFLNYRYVANERPAIDTRNVSTCNLKGTDCRVGILVGDPRGVSNGNLQTVQTDGGSGFMVRVYDKLTLAVLDARSFGTGGQDPTRANDEAKAMATYLNGLRDSRGNLVVITSYRSPKASNVVVSHDVQYQTMVKLSEAVASVGGTRDTFNRAVGQAGQDYTLVGWSTPASGLGHEGSGSEASGADARMRAVLRRDQFSLFRPVNGSSELPVEDDLASVAWATPTGRWPALDSDVIAYLQGSEEVKDTNHPLHADPRRQYWEDAALKKDDGSGWTALAAAVKAVPIPTDLSELEFTAEEFQQTQTQLHDEMVLVGHVRESLDNLASPLRAVQGDLKERVSKIVNKVYEDAKEQKEAEFDWEGLFGALVSIVAVLGPLGLVKVLGVTEKAAEALAHALHATAGLVEASAWGVEQSKDGPPSYDTFALKKDEIVDHMGARTAASISNLSIMGDLVVADWSKLSLVGSWCIDTAKPEGVCGAEDQEWVSLATTTLKRGNDRAVFTAVAPLAYAAYDLGATYYPVTNPHDFLDYYYCGARASFSEAPDDAVAVLRRGNYVPNEEPGSLGAPRDPDPNTEPWTLWPTTQVYVLGLKMNKSPQWDGESYPDAEILERMFDPVVAGGNPDDGGLGMSKGTFTPSLPHNWSNGCDWLNQNSSEGTGYVPVQPPGVR